MDMIERVARAMAENHWPVDFNGTKQQFLASHWRYHEDDARAALAAMRITEDAPAGNAFDNAFALVKSDWNAAIDAALRPSS